MKLTQQEIILRFLESMGNKWIPSYHLLKANTPFGWLGSGADRQAREMAEHGIIERKRDGKYAYYKAKIKETLF